MRFQQLVVLVSLLGASAASAQQTFTFNPTVQGNLWPDHLNWDGPSGEYPQAGDIATIPDGETCVIDDTQEAAAWVIVDDGATLKLQAAGVLTVTSLDVDGEIVFVQVAGEEPRLEGPLSNIDGSGTLNASDADGYGPAYIDSLGTGAGINIGEGVTIKGSFTILEDLLITLDGDLVVDDADDTMILGVLDSVDETTLWGDGSIQVSAGELFIGNVELRGLSPGQCDLDIELSGGVLWMTQYASHIWNFCTVTMTGGLWDLDTSWESRRNTSLKGGTMQLTEDKTVELW